MSKEERLELLIEMKKKELTMSRVAAECGISNSLLSQWFNSKCNMSKFNVDKVVNFIRQAKEYRWQRVELSDEF